MISCEIYGYISIIPDIHEHLIMTVLQYIINIYSVHLGTRSYHIFDYLFIPSLALITHLNVFATLGFKPFQ